MSSAEPTNTVVGSVFTDAWPVAWVSLGATDDGAEFAYELKAEAISVAEFFDPITYQTTERAGSIGFACADWTLSTMKRLMNGGTLATVSGSGTTLLSSYVPPTPGNEVRCMIGWESLDHTARMVIYQTLQAKTVKTSFKKKGAAMLPAEFQFEVPAAGNPFKVYAAGPVRVGS